MSNRGSVQSTAGQIGELVGNFTKFLIRNLTALDGTQLRLLEKKQRQLFNGFKGVVDKVLGVASKVSSDLASEWERYYQEVYGLTVDLSGVITEDRPGFWPIVVAPGVTYNQIIAGLRKLFHVWVFCDDLDKAIDTAKEQRRATDEPYVVWVRANVEADLDNAGKSANDLVNTSQITLMERLLLEGVYFKRTESHLDIKNVTLCAGLRDSGGYVPGVYWGGDGGRLDVDDGPAYRHDSLRSRGVSC